MRVGKYIRLLCCFVSLPLCTPAAAQTVRKTVNIENPVLWSYLDDSDYNPDDYTCTNIDRHVPDTRADRPAPVEFKWDASTIWDAKSAWDEVQIDIYDMQDESGAPFVHVVVPASRLSCKVYNLIPDRSYSYLLSARKYGAVFPLEEGTFFVEGRRRMIKADYVTNIRDFGGEDEATEHSSSAPRTRPSRSRRAPWAPS